MLKIYRVFEEKDQIKIQDYLKFKDGRFNTGLHGFGEIKSGNNDCIKANYELQTLKSYKKYLQSIKKIDGYVQNFLIFNPYNYQMLESQYKDVPKNFEAYEQYGLNEEAILLFADWVRLDYPSDGSVIKIFGRFPECGMYLIMPNASFDVSSGLFNVVDRENYEVLQSQSLGKRLVLQKMDRKI